LVTDPPQGWTMICLRESIAERSMGEAMNLRFKLENKMMGKAGYHS